ncbi:MULTISPECIES: 3-dehydroquinate synthase II [unclassified Nocardia]|uniref:3-dehydroquinate synthase II n=1 Tax=unclassified Nocardia TaxID=2637762 RepID=UPI00272ECB27|nr:MULTISPECIES: 3-dehydroquinate synthase II [unclassified Nocardia]
MGMTWLDIRCCGDEKKAVAQEAIHAGIDGIVAGSVDDLADLPPNIQRILFYDSVTEHEEFDGVDVLLVHHDVSAQARCQSLLARYPGIDLGTYIEVSDADTLQQACDAASTWAWTVLDFRDPTKIPLEIVLAAAHDAPGNIVTVAQDVVEAKILYGVLERGSDGVMMAPQRPGDASKFTHASRAESPRLDLVELEVIDTRHVGMGERACVDTCTYLRKDEGILVGSHSKGMILCVSETHPLPYMKTRPFRVNAGAIHSYTVLPEGRTNYLSELQSGDFVLAVDIKGNTRQVIVGRVKIESRPLISIRAVAEDGRIVNLILQDDWHVRVLGPAGVVLNSTSLRAGDKVLGYLPTQDRHVGYPIEEFCLEQ